MYPYLLFAQRTSSTQKHLLEQIDHVLIVGCVCLTVAVIGLTAIVVTNWRIGRERQVAAGMIQDMLAHNLSADEIERIMVVWAANSEDVSKIIHRQKKDHQTIMKFVKKQNGKGSEKTPSEKIAV